MPDRPKKSSLDQPAYGMWVIVAGLVAVIGIAVVAVLKYDDAADVVTVMGSISGVVAALVGAYFGVRGATLAQQKANEANEQVVVVPDDGTPVTRDGQRDVASGVVTEAARPEGPAPR